MNKSEYQNNILEHLKLRDISLKDSNRLKFHLMPNGGWLNDPNGLCNLNDTNHIYYQFSPFTTKWGMKCWGHYTTADWINYKEEEPFLFPDHPDDKDGVYSGSAFIENKTVHYFYTGNVKYVDKDYDYILDGREQNTIKVTSKDGFTYTDKQLLLSNNDYPANISKHVRDPKIIKYENAYYMVLGARDKENKGCVLIYKSANLENFKYHMTIENNDEYGYMWECPDLFYQNENWFLIFCPQFKEGTEDLNKDRSAYLSLDLDLINKTYRIKEYSLLDYGFDFYAPQSFTINQRRILIGWMGIPDSSYTDVTENEAGWVHALTLPREIQIKGSKILQQPIKELKNLRIKQANLHQVYDCFELNIEEVNTLDLNIGEINLSYLNGYFTLDLSKCGKGRGKRKLYIDNLKNLSIFKDTTSIEIFINDGEFCITSRCYNKSNLIKTTSDFKFTYYNLSAFNINYYYE